MATVKARPSEAANSLPSKHPRPTKAQPFIVAVTNLKGGVAKTTTAVHFAEYLRQFGQTVLVDSDPNRSALVWAGRNLPTDGSFQVISEIELARHSGSACSYVIDTKARPDEDDCRALIRTASIIVLPTSTSGDDLRITAQTARMLAQAGSTKHWVLITRAPTQAGSSEVVEAKKYLSTQGIPTLKHWIRQYNAYKTAFLDGVPVYQVKNPKAKEAWSDYQAVMREMIDGN
jgi:chromosome partitioning protein